MAWLLLYLSRPLLSCRFFHGELETKNLAVESASSSFVAVLVIN